MTFSTMMRPLRRSLALHCGFRVPPAGPTPTKDRMKTLLRCMAIAGVGILAVGYSASAQAVKGTCRPADDMSARLVNYLKSVVTPTTAADSALQASLGLTGVTAAQVTYVTDAGTCTKAAAAMNKLAQVPEPQYALYVVQVGTSYGVVDPTWDAGEWTPTVVFTSAWKLRKTLLAF